MASKNLPILDWLQIESSAPGKFIISGEYSVVYEKQAIAAAIDLRTTVIIRPNKEGKVRLHLKNLDSQREWPTAALTTYRLVSKFSECLDYKDTMPSKLNSLLQTKYQINQDNSPSTSSLRTTKQVSDVQVNEDQSSEYCQEKTGDKLASDKTSEKDLRKKADDATLAFLLLYIGLGDSYCSSARPPIDVEVKSSIPVGSGLGSSSAYSVALSGALMRVFRVAAEKYIISNWAYEIDKYFHGRPSGIDNNVVSAGGYILFQNGKIKAYGAARKNPIKVLLIDTCVSRSTKKLSESVAAQLRDNPGKVNGIFNTINSLATQIWRCMNDAHFTPSQIADHLEENQKLLELLGVGHKTITDIRDKSSQFNLKAKQTGAGGGGTAFILYDNMDNLEDIEKLRNILTSSGYKVHDHVIGCEGLMVKIVLDPEREFLIGDT